LIIEVYPPIPLCGIFLLSILQKQDMKSHKVLPIFLETTSATEEVYTSFESPYIKLFGAFRIWGWLQYKAAMCFK